MLDNPKVLAIENPSLFTNRCVVLRFQISNGVTITSRDPGCARGTPGGSVLQKYAHSHEGLPETPFFRNTHIRLIGVASVGSASVDSVVCICCQSI